MDACPGAADASGHGCVRGDEGTGLHEEGPQRMLEGGDRTVDVGEGGLEMCEDLRHRSVRGFGRQRGRRAPARQCRADLALTVVESFPDALQGPVTQMAVGGADGCEYTAGGGAFEEPPQTAGCQAEPSDFVGDPDAESPPATATCITVTAKDPPRAHRLSLGVALVKAAQKAVPNQRTDNLAVRAGRLLEPFRNRDPFLGVTVEPSLLTHSGHASTKIVILLAWERNGVVAGYDKDPLSGVRGKNPGQVVLPRLSLAKFSV